MYCNSGVNSPSSNLSPQSFSKPPAITIGGLEKNETESTLSNEDVSTDDTSGLNNSEELTNSHNDVESNNTEGVDGEMREKDEAEIISTTTNDLEIDLNAESEETQNAE